MQIHNIMVLIFITCAVIDQSPVFHTFVYVCLIDSMHFFNDSESTF